MGKVLNILFVEDDAIETIKFNRVLKTLDLKHTIIAVSYTHLRAHETG
jgi:hypothetical protein